MYRFDEDSDMGQILQEMSCICAGLCERHVTVKQFKNDLEYVIGSAEYLLSALNNHRLDIYKVKK